MADVEIFQETPIFIFLTPRDPTTKDYISVSVSTSPIQSSFQLIAPNIYNEIHTLLELVALNIQLLLENPSIDVTRIRAISVERRLNKSSWQARLGSRLDPIKQKLLDNSLLLTANPTDMLRIRTVRDTRTQDILSRTIVSTEILPILLPVMKDVPLRRMIKDDTAGTLITSFSTLDEKDSKPFIAYSPLSAQLQREDLLIRLIRDPYSENPYLMILQVKDELGTISYSSLLYVKYQLSFYDEDLPEYVINQVKKAIIKREELKW